MSIKFISSVVLFALCLVVLNNQALLGQPHLPRTRQATSGEGQALAAYQKWLNEDVVYIITGEEKSDFLKLTTNQDRDTFIVNFWEQHNPAPGSGSNPFKKEHYRRLAYVNQHFASDVPGWKTDRGRIYILYGPPDERETQPASSGTSLPSEAPETARYPTETWRYHRIAGVGQDLIFVFIYLCSSIAAFAATTSSLKIQPRSSGQRVRIRTFELPSDRWESASTLLLLDLGNSLPESIPLPRRI